MGADDPAAVMKPPGILDKLFQSGYRFSFFQAVYILERLYRDSALPGEGGPLSQERIRFRANPKRSFPVPPFGKRGKRIQPKPSPSSCGYINNTRISHAGWEVGSWAVYAPIFV